MADHLANSIVWNTKQIIPLKKYKELNLSTPSIVRAADPGTTALLPRKLLQEDLLLHSIVPHKKIICQCVNFVAKDGQLYFSQQRFSIPLAYTGWLEVLSEDGKAIAPCKTIAQIVDNSPEQFLVRSRVKAFLSEENGEPNYDKTRIVQKGEVMTVIGSRHVTAGWRKQKKQILHCLDSDGFDVYFDFKTTGQFSPMAGPTNISGVHTIEGLISRFRLPLTARVVSGKIPQIASENDRPGLFRLVEVQKDVTALFLPIHSNQKLIPVSIRTNVPIIQAANMNAINRNDYYQQLHSMCSTKCEKYFKTMQILVSATPKDASYNASTLPVRRTNKTGSAQDHMRVPNNISRTEEDLLFEEVDDLYAYVRRGGVPPRPRPRSWAPPAMKEPACLDMSENKSNSQPILSNNGKPRGLLASLTAGKFPTSTKASTIVRQRKISTSPTGSADPIRTPIDLPKGKDSILRAFIDRYKGSVESMNSVQVDPHVDERHYQNFATIERAKKSGIMRKQQSLGEPYKKFDQTTLPNYTRSQSLPSACEDMDFIPENDLKSLQKGSAGSITSPSSHYVISTIQRTPGGNKILTVVHSSSAFTQQSLDGLLMKSPKNSWKLPTTDNIQQHAMQIS